MATTRQAGQVAMRECGNDKSCRFVSTQPAGGERAKPGHPSSLDQRPRDRMIQNV
jgi:hypothetical protein